MKVPGTISLLFWLAVILIFVAVVWETRAKHNFMKACLDDGKKEYECEAMWRGGYR